MLNRVQTGKASKKSITIRVDTDVLAWFRAQVARGGSYQTLINNTLRTAMRDEEALVTIGKLRAVLREELAMQAEAA